VTARGNGFVTTATDDAFDAAAGVQAGYNFANCNSIIGIEADFSWNDQSGTFGLTSPFALTHRTDLNWMSTVRLRAGLTVDAMLIYLTGGLAFADVDNISASNVPGAVNFRTVNGDTKLGWTVGGGIEYMITERISMKGEALYTRFETNDFRVALDPILAGQVLNMKGQEEVWTIRMGVNFKFGDRAIDYSSPYK